MDITKSNTFPFSAVASIVVAIYLSIVAGFFSIVGMMALFSATAVSVAMMMIGLETGKVVASCCLKFNKTMQRLHRLYLYVAVAVLMTITAIGVYGYLAKGHLEQQAPLAPIQLQIAQGDARIVQLKQQLADLNVQQGQINASVDAVIRNTQSARDARTGLRARASTTRERQEIQTRVDSINTEINQISQRLVPLRMQTVEVTAKLGPVQYIADAFGWRDPETAVRIIILMLMVAFDPLAIVLLIVGAERITEWNRVRKEAPVQDDAALEENVEPLPVSDTPAAQEPEVVPPAEPVDPVEKHEPHSWDMNKTWPTPEPEPVVPSPMPAWAYTPDDLSAFTVPKPFDDEGESLLPELERIRQEKRDEVDHKAAFMALIEEHPELIEEIMSAAEEAQESDANEDEDTAEKPLTRHEWLTSIRPTPDPE